METGQTASNWVSPHVGPEAPRSLTYNETLQVARREAAEATPPARGGDGAAASTRSDTSTGAMPTASSTPKRDPAADGAPVGSQPLQSRAAAHGHVQGQPEPSRPLGDPLTMPPAAAATTTAAHASATEPATRVSARVVDPEAGGSSTGVIVPVAPVDEPVATPRPERATPPVAERPVAGATVRPTSRPRRFFAVLVTLVWLAAVGVSAGRLAAAHDLWSQPDDVTRIGSVVATWLGIVTLARRCGGRWVLIGLFAGVILGLVSAYPENWALAGAGVTAASVHGVLGMTLTRPATGLRTLRELLISAVIGAAGAVVVTGYDVVLRPFRFRVMVLTLVLVGGFALAWRLGQGARSIGRRGLVLITGGVVLLAVSVAYTQAIRAWGSPEVVSSVTDLKDSIEARLGAVPRPIEAFVGFPALVWGVAIRTRRRQGWWMCAFGGLGAAGLATSLLQPTTPFVDSVAASGYDLLIGAALGLVLVQFDRLLTGRGRRAASIEVEVAERPEPPRFAPLL